MDRLTTAGREALMSGKKSDPPSLASWLLRFARPRSDNDALTGDLIERFREGQTRGWFWRQVLIAFAVRVLGEVRRHWPHFCYAMAGTAMPAFLLETLKRVPFVFRWWSLPWPWSQLVFELSAPALAALGAFPALGAGLVINGTFRWASLFRTGVINLALMILGKFLFDAFLPLLSRPVPGNPHLKAVVVPGVCQILVSSPCSSSRRGSAAARLDP
jgi:hypothetical protein